MKCGCIYKKNQKNLLGPAYWGTNCAAAPNMQLYKVAPNNTDPTLLSDGVLRGRCFARFILSIYYSLRSEISVDDLV
jgi:hypothetical protein